MPQCLGSLELQLLQNPDTLPALRWDIKNATAIYCFSYLIEEDFFSDLFATHLSRDLVQLLVDHRQRPVVKRLTSRYSNLWAATYASNRTMHSKAFLLYPQQIAYVGSHNLTRGSFTLAHNSSVRTQNAPFFQSLIQKFHTTWKRSKLVPRPLSR